jgi:hypothetical protein
VTGSWYRSVKLNEADICRPPIKAPYPYSEDISSVFVIGTIAFVMVRPNLLQLLRAHNESKEM